MNISKPKSNTEGKEEWMKFLKAHGYVNIKESEPHAYYDVEADRDGVKYIFELKNRTYRKPLKSSKYHDNIIQLDKLQRLLDMQNECARAYIVNFFDDCVYINPISRPYTIQKHNCCKTTSWGGPRIEKQIVSWDHSVCQCIWYENGNGVPTFG